MHFHASDSNLVEDVHNNNRKKKMVGNLEELVIVD